MSSKLDKPCLVVDVSPLWELQYTGVSNVVLELTRRFLADEHSKYNLIFTVFHKIVDQSVIEDCVATRCGVGLHRLFEENPPRGVSSWLDEHPRQTVGLHLHRKPEERLFDFETQLHYDFSFLSVPECHTQNTIDYHLTGLCRQIATTDRFFTISKSTARDLHFYFGVDADLIQVAYLGPNVDESSCENLHERLGTRNPEKYFLCLGTIEPRKNVRLVLAWLQQNIDVMKTYRFAFVGRDGWGDSFVQMVRDYEMQAFAEAGRIAHLGYVSEAQKYALVMSAAGLIYPSLFEGFGLPILEAMALGVPVASSCSTSLPEVLGPDGIYFDPYSVDSFDCAMKTIMAEDITGQFRARSAALKIRSADFTYDNCFQTITASLDTHFFNHDLRKAPKSRKVLISRRNGPRKQPAI